MERGESVNLAVLKAIGITSTEIVRSKPFILKKTIPPPARYDLPLVYTF